MGEKFLDKLDWGEIFGFDKSNWWMTGKWSERCEQRIEISWVSDMELHRMWSIRVAELSRILVGFVTSCKKPNEKTFSTYSEINLFDKSKTLRLKSPYTNTCSYFSPRSASKFDSVSENWLNCCVKVRPWNFVPGRYTFPTTIFLLLGRLISTNRDSKICSIKTEYCLRTLYAKQFFI